MIKQKLLIPIVASAAIGGYALTHSDLGASGDANVLESNTGDPLATAAIRLAEQPLEEPVFLPVPQLTQIMRFDINPGWVKLNWPRVSKLNATESGHALRVAVVTGTQPTDISGSLTYNFDANNRVQRIDIVGITRDPRRLLEYAASLKMARTQTTGQEMFVARQLGKPVAILQMESGPVTTATAAAPTRFRLEVLAPRTRANLSAAAQQMLNR